MKKYSNIRACIGNDIRYEMVVVAGKAVKIKKDNTKKRKTANITKEGEFRFADIVNEDTIKAQGWDKVKKDWLKVCFQELIKAEVFIKVENTYKYTLNKDLILDHAKAIEGLTN